jgi:zinc and cadmium transporter
MNFLSMIIATALTAILSLSGGFILLIGSKKSAKLVQKYGTAFAIVVLLAVVFLDIIPEILEEGSMPVWLLIILIVAGLVSCIAISFVAGHFHRHGDEHTFHNKKQAVAMLIVDSLHTAVDGVVLGACCIAGPSTGILAALATTAHEIPQEIGDFSIMIRSRMPAKKIAKLQIVSSLILVPAATAAYFAGNIIEPYLPTLMALIAGFFLYIAFGEICSIIKRIKDRKKRS